ITEDQVATLIPAGLTVDGDDTANAYTLTTQAAHGTVVDNNGTFTYTPNATYFEGLAHGTTVTDTFTYTATDGHGDASTATGTVTITVPAETVTAHDVSATITEDQVATLIPAGLTVDGDDTANAYTLTTQAAHGTVVDNNGTFTYTPNATYFEGLAHGTTVTDTFTYTATDGHG